MPVVGFYAVVFVEFGGFRLFFVVEEVFGVFGVLEHGVILRLGLVNRGRRFFRG